MLARDGDGALRQLIIRNVRCVPTIPDTLISVDQLWDDARVDTVFRDVRSVLLPGDDTPSRRFPFQRERGLNVWHAIGNARDPAQPFASLFQSGSALNVHSVRATSHVTSLSADAAAAVFHRRLHVGTNRIRRLPILTADAPETLMSAAPVPCNACMEANAPHLTHSGTSYKPSYPGRLVHADIAGPFVLTTHGSFRYVLVLVDDHSRFKAVYCLQKKSDAPKMIRRFIASLNALLNKGKVKPTQIVGSLHSDNAGEFLSREFQEFLDQELVSHTTCPPHIHQLNGVAERAIRSIMEATRAAITASGAPLGFWNYALQHSVDVLNRTTGPPDSDRSAYEALTGNKPYILPILPYGCRMWACKPRPAYSKTRMEGRAWLGVNLGRSAEIPGAYHIWVPSIGRIVTTSDAYADETFMPWLPEGEQRVSAPVPHAVTDSGDQPPGVPPTTAAPQTHSASPDVPATLPQAYSDATSRTSSRAASSRTVLLLFSGPYARPDGVAAFLQRLGLQAVQVDCDATHGGGTAHDLRDDTFYQSILQRCHDGDFIAVLAAPPCSTFSVARFFDRIAAAVRAGRDPPKDPGPPPVRTRGAHIAGLPDLSPGRRKEAETANLLVKRTAAILLAASHSGAEWILENPADRGDRSTSLFLEARHAPLWEMPEIKALAADESLGTESVTFPLCAFGAAVQKYTTFLATSRLATLLRPLNSLKCTHKNHDQQVGGQEVDGVWSSAAHAAYPPDLNLLLARLFASLVFPVATVVDRSSEAEKHIKPSRLRSQEHIDLDIAGEDQTPDTPASSTTPVAHAAATEPPSPVPMTLDISEPPSLPHPKPPPKKAVQFDRAANRSKLDAGKRHGEAGSPIATRSRASRSGNLLIMRAASRGLSSFPPFAITGCARKLSSISSDPRSRREALADDATGWSAAERKELNNHQSNGSWVPERRSSVPAGRKLVRLI